MKALLGLPETAALPDDPVEANRNPAAEVRPLEQQAIANLQRWYEADFRLVELCKSMMIEQQRLPPIEPAVNRAIQGG